MNHCPKCGSKHLIPYTDKVFCIYCNWKGSPDDLDDDHTYTIKQRKSKLINLKNVQLSVSTNLKD